MTETNKYYDIASLAEASYVLFDRIANFPCFLEDIFQFALEDKNYQGYFSATQAENFVEKFELIYHQPNTPNGFSAALFESKENSGEFYYAICGSEITPIYDKGDKNANLDITLNGLAIRQIIDMYNDWQRLKAPAGAVYQAAELIPLPNETDELNKELNLNGAGFVGPYRQSLLERKDIIIDKSGFFSANVYTIKMGNSDDIFSDPNRIYGTKAISETANVTVVGQSLGGHLAAAFSRLFPDECSDALTINGAGFMTENAGGKVPHATTDIRNLFFMLGGADQFNSSEILNLYGEKGLEFTSMDWKYALVQQGGHQGIYIEEQYDKTLGHGKSQMTDSLAVYNLFAQLDIDKYITYEFKRFFDELNPVFNTMERGGRSNLDTYENIVNAFGDALVNGYHHIERSQWAANREGLYKAIDCIQRRAMNTLVDITILTEMSTSEIESQAKADDECGIAFRYSLVNLIPFAITGEQVCYDNLNIGGKLDIHTSENTDGELTEHYIEERSMFLYHLMNPEATLSGGSDIVFIMKAFQQVPKLLQKPLYPS